MKKTLTKLMILTVLLAQTSMAQAKDPQDKSADRVAMLGSFTFLMGPAMTAIGATVAGGNGAATGAGAYLLFMMTAVDDGQMDNMGEAVSNSIVGTALLTSTADLARKKALWIPQPVLEDCVSFVASGVHTQQLDATLKDLRIKASEAGVDFSKLSDEEIVDLILKKYSQL